MYILSVYPPSVFRFIPAKDSIDRHSWVLMKGTSKGRQATEDQVGDDRTNASRIDFSAARKGVANDSNPDRCRIIKKDTEGKNRNEKAFVPSGKRWGTSSTKCTFGIEDPWQPPCSKSTWQCGRKCWANRKRSSGHREWSGLRTRRSLAWCRGERRGAGRRARPFCAKRRKTENRKTSVNIVTLSTRSSNKNARYRRTRWTWRSSTTSRHRPSISSPLSTEKNIVNWSSCSVKVRAVWFFGKTEENTCKRGKRFVQ